MPIVSLLSTTCLNSVGQNALKALPSQTFCAKNSGFQTTKSNLPQTVSTVSPRFNESEQPDNTSTNQGRTIYLRPKLGPNNFVPKDSRKLKTSTFETHVCVSGRIAKTVRRSSTKQRGAHCSKSHVSILIEESGILSLSTPRPSVRPYMRGAGSVGSTDTRPSFTDHKTSTLPAIFVGTSSNRLLLAN